MRISFASQKLAKLRFIKHILLPREPITESLECKGRTLREVEGLLE